MANLIDHFIRHHHALTLHPGLRVEPSDDVTGLWEVYSAGAGGIVTKTLRLEAAINPTPHMVVPRSIQPARHAVQH